MLDRFRDSPSDLVRRGDERLQILVFHVRQDDVGNLLVKRDGNQFENVFVIEIDHYCCFLEERLDIVEIMKVAF